MPLDQALYQFQMEQTPLARLLDEALAIMAH